MLMVWQRTPVFFLRHQKENPGRIRKRHSQPTAAQCAVKRKNAGANLRVRTSLLKDGAF